MKIPLAFRTLWEKNNGRSANGKKLINVLIRGQFRSQSALKYPPHTIGWLIASGPGEDTVECTGIGKWGGWWSVAGQAWEIITSLASGPGEDIVTSLALNISPQKQTPVQTVLIVCVGSFECSTSFQKFCYREACHWLKSVTLSFILQSILLCA